jgi:proteasome lid subunit RPN8/RPN11
MEDKIISKSINDIKDFIISRSVGNFNNEICGFVGFDENEKYFVATLEKNESSDPKSFFSINPANYLKFKNQYSMLSIFHSHVVGDENPSDFDIRMSEASCLSFMIFSINSRKFYIYEPQNKDYDVNILTRLKEKIL